MEFSTIGANKTFLPAMPLLVLTRSNANKDSFVSSGKWFDGFIEKLLLFSLSLLLDNDAVNDEVGEAPRFTVSAPKH